MPSLAGIRWDPNAPAAVLIITTAGRAALALRPHPDDTGRDCVSWSGPARRRRSWGPER